MRTSSSLTFVGASTGTVYRLPTLGAGKIPAPSRATALLSSRLAGMMLFGKAPAVMVFPLASQVLRGTPAFANLVATAVETWFAQGVRKVIGLLVVEFLNNELLGLFWLNVMASVRSPS